MKENQQFEENYANYIGTKYCVGCGNGQLQINSEIGKYIRVK